MQQTATATKCDRLFDLYDIDHDGHIDHQDVTQMVRNILDSSDARTDSPKAQALREDYQAWWNALIEHADTDDDGKVSRAEFRAVMADLPSHAAIVDTVEKAVNAVFSVMDSDDDDQVPVSEVVRMFMKGGMNSDYATQASQALDLNQDGVITREEYTTVWLGYFTDTNHSAPASRILGNLD